MLNFENELLNDIKIINRSFIKNQGIKIKF